MKNSHIGIVEKVQETSSNTGIHDTTVCVCHYYRLYTIGGLDWTGLDWTGICERSSRTR